MAGIILDNKQYLVIPAKTGVNERTSGSYIYKNIVFGKVGESWSKTTPGGVIISCNGTTLVTISKAGLASQTVSFPSVPNGYVVLRVNNLLSPSSFDLIAFNVYSSENVSSGVQHFSCVALDGVTTGTYTSLSQFLAAYQNYQFGKVLSYINLSAATGGGVVEWDNQAFANGATYLLTFGSTGAFQSSPINSIYSALLVGELRPDPQDVTDPYDAGGTSEPGGGEGDFDGTSDAIDIPPLPTVSAVDAGFITLFNPTLAELKSLSSYMWSGLFDVATFRKLFADPMDAILGLSLVPVAVPDGSSTEVTVGNIPTGVYMTLASSQYAEVDCGTLNVNEYWGAYLDYEPYTRAELYLPYIGMHAISVDDIMGKAVSIKYHVDVLSGACVAYVKCGDSVLYSYVGQCSMQIPLTSTNWASAISAALNLAGSIGMTIASGGLSAPVTAASVVGVASSAASAANQIKPSIQRSGAMAGTGGYMANQKPYIILTRPRQCLPADQNKILGYPSFVTMDLSELEGYTQIAEIHLSGIPATSSELAEIESLLKEGVIF